MTTEATPTDLVDDLAHALQHLFACRSIVLRVDGGMLNLGDALYEIEHAGALLGEGYQAARIMADGEALAAEFPKGGMAPPIPTPRQVFYLRDIAKRQALGGHMHRSCESTCVDGSPCLGSALIFPDRPVCLAHATAEEKDLNRKLRDEYRRSDVRGGL